MGARSLRRSLALCAAGLGAWSCGGREPALHGVVLITCDTLRADHLGAYGYPFPTSPNLDRLAQEAVLFERAWSTAPMTVPALSALHTGRMPEELGLSDNRTLLAGEAETLAEVLAAHGLDTCAIVSNAVLRRRAEVGEAGVQQGFAHFDDRMETPEAKRPQLKERLASDTTSAAIGWLEQHGSEPYFLWVHYQDPHGPYTPPADCLPAVAREPTGEAPLEPGPDQKGKGALPKYQMVDDERRPEVYRQRYDAEIRYFDRELGRLIEHLRASGELDRVLLVFTADHGEALGEHGYYFCHGHSLHGELVHVPLLLRVPPVLPVRAGSSRVGRVATPVSHLDIYPTVLAALGFTAAPTKGVDLLGSALPGDRVLPQFLRGTWGATDAHHRMIVDGTTAALYDIQQDPGEEHDLSASHPELVRKLSEGHAAFVQRASAPPLQSVRAPPTETEEKALHEIGY